MRILLIIQGDFGARFVENITKYKPVSWEVASYTFPQNISIGIDESFDRFLPQSLPKSDLLIMLQENSMVAEMTPNLTKICKAKAVIAPIDNKAYLSSGLARQIKNKLLSAGIEMVYPMTFCTLTEKDSDNIFIKEFTRYFGKPSLAISLEMEKVKQVEIIREAPCGNTRFVAQHLVGIHKKDAVEQSGLMHHQHPCLATMTMDKEIGDTLMHHSGLMTKLAVEEALNYQKIFKEK
ncbi:MAG: hypothetical protein DDT40_00183 [candidate division WS2 bacterium]|uniref:Thymidylate synthase n=1 Tax=Psychracetigena formicireducens TaxID=2986056 RepID=A0A9E2BKT9_PSYF1|nr:hypothetical protein [Candidatus Psychracetigena formicireducens]MBT9144909.1 hypothetical protein [Candidatus Psychracetigena formicireducens]MBT9150017.1 hypothetical protein [Candidatus Psychracetigena formicireducens]